MDSNTSLQLQEVSPDNEEARYERILEQRCDPTHRIFAKAVRDFHSRLRFELRMIETCSKWNQRSPRVIKMKIMHEIRKQYGPDLAQKIGRVLDRHTLEADRVVEGFLAAKAEISALPIDDQDNEPAVCETPETP